MFAALAPIASRPVVVPRRASSFPGARRVVTRASDDPFISAPAPDVGSLKNKDAKKAAKKAEKTAKKSTATAAPLQKPKRRKPTSGEKKADLPPTEQELRASAKYDAMVEDGGKVYECFVRAKGPNQWFPLGPMAVKQDWMIVPEMWKAESDMKKAGFKMYPALMNAPCFGKVEYGYRERDDSKKITEEQIRAAAGTLNPFEDVRLLEVPLDGTGAPPEPTMMEKINKFMNPYGTGKEGEGK
tara:strand:+ start:1908 stop:2633 length:726 start_codon:yes stop_codon:yes gene_type:complete